MIKPWMIYRFLRILNFFLTGACLVVLTAAARILMTQDSVGKVHSEAVQVSVPRENVQKVRKINYSLPENLMTDDVRIVENLDTGIQLKGMMSYPDHHYAVVEFEGEQKLVKIGEKIGAWLVEDISDAELTINYDGKTAVLRQQHQVFKNHMKPQAISGKKKEIPPIVSRSEISVENRITVDEQVFHGLMNNWADLFKGVQMMPYVEKGKSKGYVLCYLQPDGLMQKLGFKTGDIVEKINDREITNLRALMALYDFAEKGDCRVEIKRGPKRIQMTYQLSKHRV